MKKDLKNDTRWTQFMDMHSGGGLKEKWQYIYIEAPEEEAEVIFQNRFGHNPNRVTCTCCGEDYSIVSHKSLAQLTGFERGCRNLDTPPDPKTGLYKNDAPEIEDHYYLEEGEQPPKGFSVSAHAPFAAYQTLDEYCKRDDVLVIHASEIKPEERIGELRPQGYVWVD